MPCEGQQDGSEWMVALGHPKNTAPTTLWFMAPCPEQREQSWRGKNKKNSNNVPFQQEQFFSQVFLPFFQINCETFSSILFLHSCYQLIQPCFTCKFVRCPDSPFIFLRIPDSTLLSVLDLLQPFEIRAQGIKLSLIGWDWQWWEKKG